MLPGSCQCTRGPHDRGLRDEPRLHRCAEDVGRVGREVERDVKREARVKRVA